MVESFQFNRLPTLYFGRGEFDWVIRYIPSHTTSILLVYEHIDAHCTLLQDWLKNAGYAVCLKSTEQEGYESPNFDLVISLGAGKVIALAKTLSQGCFHIAIPTTHGTGVAMNGVVFGPNGERKFKGLLADVVIADPAFIDQMSRDEYAWRGLGVLMNLLEGYVAKSPSVISECLIWSGLEAFSHGFIPGLEGDELGRDKVFYASLMGGIATGELGFGLAHHLALQLEPKSRLSYAQLVASICAEVCNLEIEALNERLPDSPALDKFAMCGELFAGRPFEDREEAYASLVGTLRRWVARLDIPLLDLPEQSIRRAGKRLTQEDVIKRFEICIFEEELTAALSRRTQV